MPRIRIFPHNEEINLEKATSVENLLNRLKLPAQQTLVIRNRKILTPDVLINKNDLIEIRPVTSTG